MASYDEAVFNQRLRKCAVFNTVTLEDIEEAFWASCWQIEAGLQGHPLKLILARATAKAEIIPMLVEVLPTLGLRLRS